MPGLRVLQTLSAGVDWLLPSAPPGVRICDAGGTRDIAVAEWVLATILASTIGLGELRDRQREHRWERREPSELAGSAVMILGDGSIGGAVEARLAPFGVEPIRVARHARPGVHAVEDLPALLGRAEIVVVLLPLTPETTGLLGAELLGRLRPGRAARERRARADRRHRGAARAAAGGAGAGRARRDRPRATAGRSPAVGCAGHFDHPPHRG